MKTAGFDPSPNECIYFFFPLVILPVMKTFTSMGLPWNSCCLAFCKLGTTIAFVATEYGRVVPVVKIGTCLNEDFHMVGYATDATLEQTPLSHVLATKLGVCLAEACTNGTCTWLRHEGKTQVIVEYRNDIGDMVPIRVNIILISIQLVEIVVDLKEHSIKPVVLMDYLDENTIFT